MQLTNEQRSAVLAQLLRQLDEIRELVIALQKVASEEPRADASFAQPMVSRGY